MKRLLFVGLMVVSLSASALTEKINYEFVAEVKSKRMGEYLVRYLITLDSVCMGYIQSLTSDYSNNWTIYQTKTLCELDGKSTATGFTDATITKLEFKENSIHMVISTTELRPTGEYLRHCTIKVNKGRFSSMHCSKPEYAKDFEL
jgi:hypothetical protein